MRFISVRDLRGRPARVWSALSKDQDLVLTSNGKPIAILSAVSEETLEEALKAVRQARAIAAVERLQVRSLATGRDALTPGDINAEIAAARRARRR